MDWIESESIGLDCPGSADELVGCEAFEGLEAASEVVGSDEVGEVRFELLVVIVMEALNGGLLEGPVHSLDLTVRPRVLHLGEAMLDAVFTAAHVEHMRHVASRRAIRVARWKGELDAVVGEDSVDLVGHGLDQGREEGGGGCPAGLPGDLDESEFARTIDSDVEVELALGGLHLGDVDMKEADRIGLELLANGLVAFEVGQSADAVALKTAV